MRLAPNDVRNEAKYFGRTLNIIYRCLEHSHKFWSYLGHQHQCPDHTGPILDIAGPIPDIIGLINRIATMRRFFLQNLYGQSLKDQKLEKIILNSLQ